MPSCCIRQCRARKSIHHPTLTIHKFPKNEIMRKKWLDIIGINNINPRSKIWYICSLHFDDSSFNRTLNILRLRDGAVPLNSGLSQSSQLPRPVAGRSRDKGSSSTSSCGSDDDDDSTVPQIEDAKGDSNMEDQSIHFEVKTNPPDEDLNEGFVCNQCHGLIVRFRYVCVECADYDLCAACESQAHHAAHYMLRVPPNRDQDEVARILSAVRAVVTQNSVMSLHIRHTLSTAPHYQTADNQETSVTDEIKIEVKEEIDIEENDPLSTAPPLPSASNEATCETWTHTTRSSDTSINPLIQASWSLSKASQTPLQESSHIDIVEVPATSESLLPAPTNTLMLTITPQDRGSYKLETSGKVLENIPLKRNFEPESSKTSDSIILEKLLKDTSIPIKRSFEPDSSKTSDTVITHKKPLKDTSIALKKSFELDSSKISDMVKQKKIKILSVLPVSVTTPKGNIVKKSLEGVKNINTSGVSKTAKLVKLSDIADVSEKRKQSDVPCFAPRLKGQGIKLIKVVDDKHKDTVTVHSLSDSE